MHAKDVEIFVLAVAVEPAAQKHNLSAAALVDCLRTLRPHLDVRTVERAAALSAPLSISNLP